MFTVMQSLDAGSPSLWLWSSVNYVQTL